MATASEILSVLDRCCERFTFPMLDNGYVFLAATRLSLHRSPSDWAMVIEVFGFSPRAGLPDLHVYPFASRLHARDAREDYASDEAYQGYLTAHPNDDSRFFHPLDSGPWQDHECEELVAHDARDVEVRGSRIPVPCAVELEKCGITMQDPAALEVFELCRYLASVARDKMLATEAERRVSVPSELEQLLQLESWHHPDVCSGALPSESQTFRQLARVLETGDVGHYRPLASPNTHFIHWPEGGRL